MKMTVCNIAKSRLETIDIDITKDNTTWFEDSTENKGIRTLTDFEGSLLISEYNYDYLKNLEEHIKSDDKTRKRKWSKRITFGSKNFLKTTKKLLRASAVKRKIHSSADSYELREDLIPYDSSFSLHKNTILWTD